MSDITWQFQASIQGGPAFTITQPIIKVAAYDVASATIGAGAGNVDVVVQPSSTVGEVLFVVVSSDAYDAGLTYKIDSSTTVHALDAPHVMLGAGAVSMMNSAPPPRNLYSAAHWRKTRTFRSSPAATLRSTAARNRNRKLEEDDTCRQH